VLEYPARKAAQARFLNTLLGEQCELVQAGPDGPRNSLILTVGTGYDGPGS
jgi:hypothetical protein